MKSRSRYIDRLLKARAAAPAITLAYHDGSRQSFCGQLPELIDQLKIEMVFSGKLPWKAASGEQHYVLEPSFVIEPRVQFGTHQPLGRISVFTKTSKMRCPSFSLPVGPPDMGGTCLAAGQRALVEDDTLFICHGCYASEGNYRQPSTQLTAGIRRMAVIRGLRRGTFVAAMVAAVKSYRSKPRFDAIKTKVDGRERTVGSYQLDTQYVRIHDAGDVLWRPGYLEAWAKIANHVPGVRFWMPTRDWALGRNAVRRLSEARASTRGNFVLRPSALHVGDPAPEVEGLDAGTSVAFDAIEHGLAEYNCPAYDQKKDKSCQTARCRTCWTQPTKTVNYEPHGAAMAAEELAAATARRRNPLPAPGSRLTEVYDAYREGPMANPADDTGFEVWMARNGLYAEDWSQDEWWHLLARIGLDGDETAEYLENVAEWQP